MPQRMALYMQDKHSIPYELDMARYAEERGFAEIWQADTRLARDCIVLMSAFAAQTRRLRIGSGVLPIWTRNPAVIAATFSTLWELAGKTPDGRGRIMLGLGAWWEPIASRVGVQRERPLEAMREYVEAIRALFTMQEVTYQGSSSTSTASSSMSPSATPPRAISRSTSGRPVRACWSWRASCAMASC